MVEVGPHHLQLIAAKYFNIVFPVLMCQFSQRQMLSSLSLLYVCISHSNYLLYTCIVHKRHSHNPDMQVVLKMNCVRSCSFYSGYQTLLVQMGSHSWVVTQYH